MVGLPAIRVVKYVVSPEAILVVHVIGPEAMRTDAVRKHVKGREAMLVEAHLLILDFLRVVVSGEVAEEGAVQKHVEGR